nr:hypothetical protein [Halomonas socia]
MSTDTKLMDSSQESLVSRLQRLDSGLISDVLDEAGWPNHSLSSILRPLFPGARIVGRAACVRGESLCRGNHSPKTLPAGDLESVVEDETVLVLASDGYTTASPIGGIVSRSLMKNGCCGIITDSAVRDKDEIIDLAFPVFAAGLSPVNAARRWHFVEANIPVTLPGQTSFHVTIHPEDLLLADNDGAVVIPAQFSQQIIEDAEELKLIESKIVAAMDNGVSRSEAFKRYPRFCHVRPISF